MNKVLVFVTIALLLNLGQCAPLDETAKSTDNAAELENQFKDIMALIPMEDIRNITNDHLANDSGFKAAIAYIQSKEWTGLIQTVKEKPEWTKLESHLTSAGLDISIVEKCVEKLLENVTVAAPDPTANKSLRGFLDDVEKVLPTMKILNILEEKMVKGANFKQLFDKLSSEETHQMVEKLFVVPEVKRVFKELSEMGVDLSDVFTLLYTVFGWGTFKPIN